MTSAALDRLLAQKTGILLDVSLGGTPQPSSVTMQEVWAAIYPRRKSETSARHLLAAPALRLPFPLPDACVHTAVVTHVVEYLDPRDFFAWWDELHRVLRPHGVVHISGPYGGDESSGWVSDPQHRVRVAEPTFAWLDHRTLQYGAHDSVGRTPPRPWEVVGVARVPGTFGTVSYNATLQTVPKK